MTARPVDPSAPLSAVIIARDEAERIVRCIDSLRFADEIVVLDSGSRDGTPDLAERHGARVYRESWRGFGPQKQRAVDLASHDMILNVDCDETVTPELAQEIAEELRHAGRFDAWTVPRRTFLGSREIRHSGWYPDRTVRLFDRRRARFSDDLVHERVLVEGTTGALRGHLLHYSFGGYSDILRKMDRYTDLSAKAMFAAGRRASLFDLLFRPVFAFWKCYFLRAGFLDGVEGIVIAEAAAMHVFAKYVKLRELGEAARREAD